MLGKRSLGRPKQPKSAENSSPLVIKPFATVSAPFSEWLADCSDSWLKEEIAKWLPHLEPHGKYATAVLVGMYLRLFRPDSKTSADRKPAEIVTVMSRVLGWILELSADQVETIQDFALVEVEMLFGEISGEHKRTTWTPDAILWFRARRDDLEGVCFIVRRTMYEERRQVLLQSADLLDRYITEVLPSLKLTEERIAASEKLLRSRQLGPSNWWVRP